MLRRSKAEVERYVAAVQAAAPSLREKSLKGFLFAKLYFEVKEYELAKRYICTYLSVQERDPKAHRFLGQIYEAEDNTEKAFGCYKRSVELNPAQKDLILKIAELLCNNDVTDERAKYWVEKSAKLFPGSPAVYKLKEQLLDCKGEDGWNQLFDLIQAELYARPDDIYINIRLVALYRSNNRLRDAVLHCQEAKKKIPLQSSLEWCSCVIETFEEYLESVQDLESDKSNWRTIKKDQLLAYCSFLKVTLSSRDAQECRGALKNLDRVLHSVKTYVSGTDELSRTFIEMKGQLYMHAGTLLLKLAQQNEAQWKEACELAALCYLISFQVPKPKSKLIKGEHTGQDTLEMLACDRKSQSGHMLLKLSHGKEDFLKEVVESLANKSGSSTLFGSLFENGASRERSFLGTDDIGNVSMQAPVQAELHKYDLGAVRMHNGSLQHLVWLCLQWFLMSVLPPVHRWLKQLFHLPQETSRLETDAPESICLLDLEVFLLGVVFTSNLQLQEKFNAHYSAHQPQFLPLLVCKQLYTEKQRAWWDAVRTLMQRKTIPETALKLRLVVQHGISTLRALEKHGLQPALIIHWAKTLQKTGISLNSFYDQKEYVGRSVYYWKRVLIMLEIVKKKRSIPEPTDPLFKHFRSVDIQVSQVTVYEEEARIAFATLDAVDGRTDDALLAFEAIKNVVSYWNLAIIFQRKAEEIENDAMLPEEQEEHKAYLFKSKHYLMKILDESSSDVSVTEKLPVSVETVREMLDTVIQELGENDEEGSLAFGNDLSPAVDSEVKHSTPLSNNFSVSPSKSYKFSPKNPPQWAEDHRSILQMICQQVEALKNEMQKMKHNNSNSNVSSHRWPGESYGTDTMSDTYQRAQNLHEAPLTVATTGPSVYYSQSPAYNSQYLLRTAATNVTPTKAPVYGMNRLAPQQHIYAYQQTIHTPPLQNTSACVFPQDLYGTSLRFDAPGIISPRGTGDYYNYSVPQASTNPQLPGPGYFTKPSVTPTTLKPAESKMIEFPKSKFGQPGTVEGSKTRLPIPAQSSQPTTFKFNTNFKSNDGDFTFSSPQATTQPANAVFNSSESLLGLLTSDKPLQDDRYAEQKAVNNHTTGQRNVFSFGNKHISGIPFTEGMAQNAHKNLAFERSDMFSFQEPSKSLFMTSTSDLANRSHETEGGSTLGDENDDGPHFDPVVPLPDKIEVKTGEEDEEEFFCNRAKLFRFDAESKEWKERGIGNVKILKHKVSGKFRLLMRRDQVLKICANHYINTDMKLTPNAGSDRSFVWHALDYADELPKPEQLAIRFKTPEEAMLFKSKFEESQNILKTLGSNVDTSVTQSSGTAREMTSQDIKKSNGSTSGTLNSVFQFPKDGVTSESGNKVSLKSVPSASALPTFSFRKEAQETLSSGGFGQSLLKKDQWECKVCSVPNEATAKNCVSCQSPNADTWQTYGTPSTESTPSFKATGNTVQDKFGSAFAKKEGQLDGSIRSVRNEPVASQNPSKMNTEISPQVSFKFVLDAPKTIQNDLGTPFSKKAGQWDCSVGLAQNEANDENCHSCQNPKSQSQPNVPVSTAQALPAPSFSSVADATATKPQENTFAELFAKKEGQWDCNTCLVRNEGSSPACVACQTPNPSGNSVNDASSTSTSDLKSKLSEPAKGQLGTGFKCDFLGKGFKLGHAEQGKTPAFTFQIPADSEVKSAKEGFNFSMSVPPGGFKFSIQEPSKNATKKDDPSKECTAGSLKNVDEKDKKELPSDSGISLQSQETASKEKVDFVFGQNSSTFTFAELAKSTPGEGFQFGKKDPDFKGFSGAGEKLFSSQVSTKTDHKASTSADLGEKDDDVYKTEDSDDIHFDPIVQMPEKVEPFTGEEDEKVLYSQRVKLFRFDPETSQWKERGVGNLKILKNEVNGKVRILMRREQVLKVCANHWITTTMNLKQLSGSDKAWMWMASDFSDGDAKLEQLAAKFKTPEQAEEFKQKFEECQRLLLDIPLQTPHKLVDTGRTAELIQKAEEMKSGLKDLKTFLTDDKTKLTEEENVNSASASSTSDLVVKPPAESTGPALEWDNCDLREEALDDSVSSSVYASPLASSPVRKNLFRFGESTTGFNFSFKSALSPSKSPSKQNQSRTSVGTDEDSDVTQDEERDGQYFEPVVPLPDLVEVTSGEEDEQVVFSHRAKLYRYDKDTNQWKERGIGEIKILQNYDNKQVRIVMRRDQVLKLCANHRITPDMNMQQMKGSDRVWVWTACDFADGERKVELLAVRFKQQDVADSFKQIFDEAKNAQEKGTLITPLYSRANTPKESPCGKNAVAVLEETTRERTDLSQGDDTSEVTVEASEVSSTSETPTKTVVSPPKFVFGSESVKSIFSNEKSKTFTFGNTSATGSLFGFSFNSPRKGEGSIPASEKEVAGPRSSSALQKPQDSKACNLATSTHDGPANFSFRIVEKAEEKTVPEDDLPTDEVIIVYELTPTPEQRALAGFLKLPSTFFCYKNKPGYVSEEDDDEDYETAVKNLNGRLYQEKKRKLQGSAKDMPENTTGDITGKTDLKTEGECVTAENTEENDVTSSTDLVSTTKEEPTESADEAIAHVQSAEEPDSSTGNTSDISLAYQASKNSGYLAFNSVDNTLPSCLAESAQENGEQNITGGLVGKTESGTEAQEFNRQGLILPHISQIYNELHVTYQELQRERSAREQYALELQRLECFLVQRETLLYRREAALAEMKRAEEEVQARFGIIKKQHETEVNRMRETLRRVTEENSKLKSSFNSVMEEDDSLRKQLSDANEQNKMLEDRARSMQAQLDNLQQHEAEMNQMRETLRQVTEENSKLKLSFNSVMEEDDSLRKQLSDANEQNKMLEDQARSMQAQLDNLQQKNASLMAQKSKDSGEVVRPCQPVKEGKETGASKSVKQHEAEMNQMRETLRQVTEENSKLKLSFNSVMGENDSLRKQLSDANEQNKMFEGRARSMQAQLDNLQQKNASLMAQMSKNSGEVVCPRKRVKVDNETGASKSVKQHEKEMNQMRETLRQVAEENSKLKSSFNSVMEEDDSLRKQLSDANEQNKVLEDRARSMQAQLDNLQQHETEMNQMRETLRQVAEENSKLKSSFNSVMGENDSLRKQLSDANEQNKVLEDRARSMQAQLDNLQQKNASLMAQMSKNSGEVVCPRKRVKVDNETGASKSVKVLLNSKVYDLLTILMDWISNQHLSKIEIQGEREGNDKPQCAKENYTPENCMKLLHMVTGQLQWMPFVDPKLHMPVIQFIYWSLRQINTGSKHASMTSTMERLGEVIFKGVVHKGYLQKWSEKSTQSKPKTALFFKSSFMPLRFLSTLILLETAKRVSYLTRAFHSLCVDLKTDEGKMLFLQYQCVPVILSHLTISRKCLLSGALDALIEMARSSDKSHLQLFLEYCSTESVFRACSALLQNPRLDICFSKKICSMLRKLSEIKSNKKMFELFALPKVIKELLRTTHPDHHHFCVDLKVILCNLGVAKSNSAKLQSKDK
ncbi:E3 SUMO-protein ligase RanBP2-like isoform X9 [Cygnus olor]|uniref:E3 SUMO-protein ligase RanBP2-like isoform X9 n=1 Tax=Cygnus olor TaxID=8869 RepID=UPI001ADE5DD2|nr:E3 SUMO-protein ligase RanBP2-like isoform X9 [Cygnus olor]